MINVIGEIGINHNGSVDLAKQLIKVAYDCGCTHVKFQKKKP
jgi:N-acetylneuraminate synthase